MARDWEISETLELLKTKMATYGENSAEVPMAMSYEMTENGWMWVVNAHIRVRGVTEFDIDAAEPLLSAALRRVYLGFNNTPGLVRRAARANEAFGITV